MLRKKQKRVSKNDWLVAAIDMLENDGIDKVNIERLARKLGISKSGEILDIGVELEIIQKSGSWFSYDGNKLGQGRDSVKKLIEDNPELMEELEKKIIEKINPKPEKEESTSE